MPTSATTPLVSDKVLPRSECSVCGAWHSHGLPENNFEILFNQCAECLEKHGCLVAILSNPGENDIGYFKKDPTKAVPLLTTGPRKE